MSQKIYIAVNKEGTPFMFTNCPKRTNIGWTGKYYVNSLLYEQVCELVEQAYLTFDDEPELVEFQMI